MKQPYTLQRLAEMIGATIQGNANHLVFSLSSLKNAAVTDLAFLANPKYANQLEHSQAGAVIIHPAQAHLFKGNKLITEQPYAAFAQLTHVFNTEPAATQQIHSTAVISPSAKIGNGVSIGAFVVVEDHAVIGDNTQLHAHVSVGQQAIIGQNCMLANSVVIHHHCQIGNHVRIHANSSIGAEGFGFAPVNGTWQRIAQIGKVVIGNNSRIGANCCVDRGALEDTLIGDNVIIDNLVQIAHNVQIGDHTAIAACCGIAGSTSIGKHCVLAGGVGIAGHLQIADNVHITGMTMITKSITQAGSYSSGTAFTDTETWRKTAVHLKKIEMLVKKVVELEKQLNQQK